MSLTPLQPAQPQFQPQQRVASQGPCKASCRLTGCGGGCLQSPEYWKKACCALKACTGCGAQNNANLSASVHTHSKCVVDEKDKNRTMKKTVWKMRTETKSRTVLKPVMRMVSSTKMVKQPKMQTEIQYQNKQVT